MRKLLVSFVAVSALALGGLITFAAPANAGCCVVVSLDPLDPPQPGEIVQVHLTTRINNDPPSHLLGEDPGIRVHVGEESEPIGKWEPFDPATGELFPAHPLKDPGRYVAEVRFPAAGSYHWEVTTGAVVVQPLGTVAVGTEVGDADTGGVSGKLAATPVGGPRPGAPGDALGDGPAAASDDPATVATPDASARAVDHRGSLAWRVVLPLVALAASAFAAAELVRPNRRGDAPAPA